MPWPPWSAPPAATRWCCRSRPTIADAIAQAAIAARACDLLVTTGGASVGDHDLVQAALGPQGFELDFWQIAMRPGKPLIWGRLGATPVLGLPGNPVSAMVCAVQFLIPAIERLSGLPGGPPRTRPGPGRGGAGGERPPLRPSARHPRRRGRTAMLVATPFPLQDSSMLKMLSRAEALILRAPRAPALPAGAAVEVIPLGDLGI